MKKRKAKRGTNGERAENRIPIVKTVRV